MVLKPNFSVLGLIFLWISKQQLGKKAFQVIMILKNPYIFKIWFAGSRGMDRFLTTKQCYSNNLF